MATEFYSSHLNSWPTTKQGSINKLLSENSLTRLINRLLNVDGFVILDGLADRNANKALGAGGKHLVVNDDLKLDRIDIKDNLFEFVIRGYYFCIPLDELTSKLNEYKRGHSTTESLGVFARIFIDNTYPDYPELIGHELMENENDPQNYCVQFYVSPLNERPNPSHPVLPIDPETNQIDGLGTTYLYYDLLLLKDVNSNGDPSVESGTFIPFSSMNKFNSSSQSIIDGGEFKLY